MQKRARTLLVWLHVVTSVGWLSQAVALLALVLYGMKTGDLSAFRMARYLDHEVLAIMANTSAFSRSHAQRHDAVGLLPALVGAREVRDHRSASSTSASSS